MNPVTPHPKSDPKTTPSPQPLSAKEPKDTRVLVAMSGGVDSSVTAALLKSQGFDVLGVHMQLSDQTQANQEKFGSRCCSIVDSNDARRVCDRIDAPFYVINAADVFEERVIDYFVSEYLSQRTPNPCVECNTAIKFSYLFQKADELECDYVATGHYAQVLRDAGTDVARLHKAVDPQKDQSYFLFGMTPEALQRTMMPLGGLTKMMVRKLAANFGLTSVVDKPDSQEICFVGSEGYAGFIEKRTAETLREGGAIKSVDGLTVGVHQGLHRFTVGQRKGLQLDLPDKKKEFYVLGFNRNERELIVGSEKFLFHREVQAVRTNWLTEIDPLKGTPCRAKIRSQHQEAACKVYCFENQVVRVVFDEPQRAITPGQPIVFYRGTEVLGGAFIERVRGSYANDGPLDDFELEPGKGEEVAVGEGLVIPRNDESDAEISV